MEHGEEGSSLQGEPRGGHKKHVMIVLCGLIGSGKSSFAKALQEYYPDYVRCNQDTLGSRNAVRAVALRSLQNGHNVVIDRTNVDEGQRATWIDLARSLPDVEVQAFYFDTPLETCKARLATRLDHETIKDPVQAIKVLQCFHRDLCPPVHTEGFKRVISIHPSDFDSAVPTRAEVDAILIRAAQAPYVEVPIVRTAPRQPPHRGRGRGRGAGGQQWQQMRGAAPVRGGGSFHSMQNSPGGTSQNWRRVDPVLPQSSDIGYQGRIALP